MRKNFFIFLLVGTFLLAGCSNAGITTKTQLIKESQIFEQNSHRQDTALSRLSKELEATVALYDQLVPDSDLDELNVSLEARDATVAELTKLNKAQAELSATFKNTVKQDNKNFPISRLNRLTHSQDITTLDHETFMKYLDKAKETEQRVTDLYKNGQPDRSDLKAAVESTTQYYGALTQQIEIWQVNAVRSKNNAESLVKSLK